MLGGGEGGGHGQEVDPIYLLLSTCGFSLVLSVYVIYPLLSHSAGGVCPAGNKSPRALPPHTPKPLRKVGSGVASKEDQKTQHPRRWNTI